MRYQIHWAEDPRIRPLLSKVAGPAAIEVIHARFAIALKKWSDRNFERGGSPKWKPLSPNTIVQRRKGSSTVLRDTGQLMLSMRSDYSPQAAVLYSRDKRAKWHQEGTPPYTIKPKNAKALAFRVAPGFGTANATYGVVGTQRITRTTRAGRQQSYNRKVYGYRGVGAGQTGNAVFLREVHHPGLPSRPLLPTEEQVWREIDPVGIVSQHIDEVKLHG